MEAATEIGRFGPRAASAVPALQKSLADPEPAVRMKAADALGMIGPASRPAMDLLRAALKDPDARVRTAAARALPFAARSEKKLADDLRPLLADGDAEARYAAAVALVRLDEGKIDALPAVRERMRDPDARRRVQAASVLMAVLGAEKAAPEVLPVLGPVLDDPDQFTSRNAGIVMAGLGAPAIPLLLSRAQKGDLDYRRRVAAIGALARMGPAAASAAPALKEIVSEHGRVGLAASRALTAILATPPPSPGPFASPAPSNPGPQEERP